MERIRRCERRGGGDEVRIAVARVREAEAKGEERHRALVVEVTVAVEVAVRDLVRDVVEDRQVDLCDGEDERQTTRGVHVAVEHVRDRGAALDARIPRHDDGLDLARDRAEREGGAAFEHEHDAARERGDVRDPRGLPVGKRERSAIARADELLALVRRDESREDDHDVGRRNGSLIDGRVGRNRDVRDRRTPRVRHQTREAGDDVLGVDGRRAGRIAEVRHRREGTRHDDVRGCAPRDRQRIIAVLEQDDRSLGDLARERTVRGRTGDGLIDDGRIGVEMVAELRAQLAAHHVVDQRLGNLARSDRVGERYAVGVRHEHLDVEAGRGRRDRVIVCARRVRLRPAPVGDDEAGKAPFILEDVAEQVGVLRTVEAVDAVVCAHHACHVSVSDDAREVRQVDLAERPRIDGDVQREPRRVDVVDREVLRRDGHLGLRTEHETDRHRAHVHRVLAVGLLRTSPARMREDVHRRPEQDVATGCTDLSTDRGAEPGLELGVERRTARHPDGERGRGTSELAQAARTVDHHEVRNAALRMSGHGPQPLTRE